MVAGGASLRIGSGDNQETFSMRQSLCGWRMEKETRGVADALIPRVLHGATLVVPFQGTQAMPAQTQFQFAPDRYKTPEKKIHTLRTNKYENSCSIMCDLVYKTIRNSGCGWCQGYRGRRQRPFLFFERQSSLGSRFFPNALPLNACVRVARESLCQRNFFALIRRCECR